MLSINNGQKKDKKNKGGTGSEYFDYRYGVGEAKSMMKRYGIEGAEMGNLVWVASSVLLMMSKKTLLMQ